MLYTDQLEKKCKKCKSGFYIERSTRDEIEGILHCKSCQSRVKRYQNDDSQIEKRLTIME